MVIYLLLLRILKHLSQKTLLVRFEHPDKLERERSMLQELGDGFPCPGVAACLRVAIRFRAIMLRNDKLCYMTMITNSYCAFFIEP